MGADWLHHNPRSPLQIYYARLPPGQAPRLVSSFSRAVVTQQPLRVLAGIARDAVKLSAVTRTTSPGDPPISRWQFQATYPTYPQHASRPDIIAAARQFGGGAPVAWRPVAGFLRSYRLDAGYPPGPLLAIAAPAGLAGSAALLRRYASPERRQLTLACLLFLSTAAALLLTSDPFEFIWRYQLPALVTLPPAGALGIGLMLRYAHRRAGRHPVAVPGDSEPPLAVLAR